MINHEIRKGPQTKVCKRPSCKVPFTRDPRMSQENWNKLEYCTRHRGNYNKRTEPRLGHYIVKNATIDKFLYG